jgi:ribosome recycling factor
VRRDSNDELKKQQKNSDITEDDLRTQTDDVQIEAIIIITMFILT